MLSFLSVNLSTFYMLYHSSKFVMVFPRNCACILTGRCSVCKALYVGDTMVTSPSVVSVCAF